MKKAPSPLISLLPIVVLVILLFATIRVFGSDALNGGSQISLLTTTAICILIGMAFYKIPWKDYELAITNNVAGVTTAIIILLIIGALSGIWMISGVVPTLIYYGMQIIHPSFFLTSTCIICVLISVMTGSSWTTIATIGIALMGIGKAQGFEEGWIAGAIISGAYFGDKVSPLSETTILAASVTDTPLFRHIRYMMITTVPSLIITLIIFTVAGLSHDASNTQHIAEVAAALNEKFHITPWLLIIPIATGILIARKVPSIITLFLSTLLAGIFALIFQPDLLREISGAAVSNFDSLFIRTDDDHLRQDKPADRQCCFDRFNCHPWYVGNDEYHLADIMCHVFRRSNDSQRYAGKHHIALRTLHEENGQRRIGYCLFGAFPQSGNCRPVHQHHPDREYVSRHLC